MSQAPIEKQFDNLADRLRRLSLTQKDPQEDLNQILKMPLEELMEERVAFGKAHIGKAFKDLTSETKYLSGFAENFRHSQKPEHVKLLRFIQLHVETLEGQVPRKIVPKAKAMFPPGTAASPIDLEDEEEETWDHLNEGQSSEMLQMQDRMNKVETMLHEVLQHLTRPNGQQPNA